MDNDLKLGLVIKAISGLFTIKYDDKLYACNASSKLKLNKNKIIAGDYVYFNEKEKYIYDLKNREFELIRPQLANVKNIMLIFSATEPKINYGLLDRMILVMEENKLNTKIIITKMDLISKEDQLIIKEKLKYYDDIGYEVVYSDNDINKITDFIKDDKYVFTGQSGVGKSTLINKLIPDLDLKTNEISKALGRGKHTTREVTFYEYQNGYIIDTPGFSALDLPLTTEIVRDNYIDFKELSLNCKYNNCYHLKEPNCGVKEKYGSNNSFDLRYDNYVKILTDIKENND